jgi:phosphatidylinositol-3-phosphatase
VTGVNDDGDVAASAGACRGCGAALKDGQRYCLGCGERSGPIPDAFAEWLSVSKASATVPDADQAAPDSSAPEDGSAVEDEEYEDASLAERFMPEPRSAAVATMALLAFGVVVGAATGPLAQSAGVSPIVIEMGSSAPPVAAVPEEEAEETEVEVEEGAEPENAGEGAEGGGGEDEGGSTPTKKTTEKFEEPPPPPPIQHVFLIALGEHGFEEGFGPESLAPYLAQELVSKGELLSNYYAVAQSRLANEVALLSGQGPTIATAEGCPEYTDIASPTVGAEEQVEGEGCAYPAETKTLPGQLVEAKRSWRAYVEGGGGCAGGESRNPFTFFHSIFDKPECTERTVGVDQLAADLKTDKTTPSLSYVVPSPCHDGSEQPCQDGHPGGLAEAQPFLEEVVPEIQESQPYKAGGLIAITFAQAPQSGPNADQSACCGAPEYPNLPQPTPPPTSSGPVKPSGGGGRVGLLLLSPYVEPGTVDESAYFNHFSLLLSIEEAFGLPPIGYAASPALTPFASAGIYNLSS